MSIEAVSGDTVAYFDQDFDWNEWTVTAVALPLPEIDITSRAGSEDGRDAKDWDSLFNSHSTGVIYKPRNYLYKEFNAVLSRPHRLLEIGCGYGSSLFSLINQGACEHYFASDHSFNALAMLEASKLFDSQRMSVLEWDFAEPAPPAVLATAATVVLAVFALSAVTVDKHRQVIRNIKAILQPGGHVLLRDYGLHDMTMYRHKRRIAEHTFLRTDNTICHYFTLQELESMMVDEGFVVTELRYATVINRNRKEGKVMHRVFVHGVFQLKPI